MVSQDAQTFVALGRAMTVASQEGALDQRETAELKAALVAGILTGCMEFDTYARVHDALADLLELAFHEVGHPLPAPTRLPAEAAAEEPLGVYLEVVGEAWDKVSWDPQTCRRMKSFVLGSFDVARSEFGEGSWFRAPLRLSVAEFLQASRAAGLLIVSIQGALPGGPVEAQLEDPGAEAGTARLLLGWGDRHTALELSPLS